MSSMSFMEKLLDGVAVEWKALGEVAEYVPTRVDAVELDATSFVGVDNLVADKGGRIDANYLPNTDRLTAYEQGDILLGNIRPYLKKVMSPLNPQYLTKKQSVFQKIAAFVEKFKGVDGQDCDANGQPVFPPVGLADNQLDKIQRNYLRETVIKHPDRAEATRVCNIPYAALEEALVNAVYHRSYEEREPIEVRISNEELVILSFPGPDRSIRLEDFQAGRIVSRRYRNRRIGEFLKEPDLTEGRSTGIPKILKVMAANGSPAPGVHLRRYPPVPAGQSLVRATGIGYTYCIL
jgi:ATP-dependent DNA helicase RecG